jgi:hypothetical protein
MHLFYLFKSHKSGLSVQALMPLAGTAMSAKQKMHSLFKALTGQEGVRQRFLHFWAIRVQALAIHGAEDVTRIRSSSVV